MITPVCATAYYLKSPYKERLESHLDKYIHSYEYVSRGNLLACDLYSIYYMPEVLADWHHRNKRKHNDAQVQFKHSVYYMKRAYPDDEQRILDYFIRYLKRHNSLDGEDAAQANIKFWMRFGAIYFIEKDNEILAMSTVLANVHGYLSINLFPFYSTKMACTIARSIITCIAQSAMTENRLPYIAICINMIRADSVSYKILDTSDGVGIGDDRMICVPYKVRNHEQFAQATKEEYAEGINNLKQFMSRFTDISSHLDSFLFEYGLEDYKWMAVEITGRDFFEDNPDEMFKLKFPDVQDS